MFTHYVWEYDMFYVRSLIISLHILNEVLFLMPIPVAARSKEWVYGR
jgi:hypothetical protein